MAIEELKELIAKSYDTDELEKTAKRFHGIYDCFGEANEG